MRYNVKFSIKVDKSECELMKQNTKKKKKCNYF